MLVPYASQIPDWFNTRKAAQVVAWFAMQAGGRINVLKATKLVYLADRESMRARDCPITGDNFVSMQFGPVNSNTYRYMCGEARVRQEDWTRYVSRREKHDLPLAKGVTEADLDELSRADLRVLRTVWQTHKDVDRFDLAEWTHKYCPEWRDPSGSSIPIECRLEVGDHPYVTGPSFIVYRIAEMPRCSHLARMVEKGLYNLKEVADRRLLSRVCKGLLASEETRPSILAYAKRQWAAMKAG